MMSREGFLRGENYYCAAMTCVDVTGRKIVFLLSIVICSFFEIIFIVRGTRGDYDEVLIEV
jgi:hypothetical protein